MANEEKLVEDLTPEQEACLRQICEDGADWFTATEPTLLADVAGSIECPMCFADARWARDGRRWSISCETCGWDAAGVLSQAKVSS